MRRLVLWLALLIACGCTPEEIAGDGGGIADAGSPDGGIDAAMPDAGTDAGDPLERCDEEGEVCCTGGSCGGGLLCDDGVCTSAGCGAIGAPCCELNQCDPGASCEAGECVEVPCGGEFAACCAEAPACTDGLECLGETCQPCGGSFEACCPGDVCDEGLDCLENLFGGKDCVAPAMCGELGSPCCEEGAPCGAGLGCVSTEPGFAPICLPGPSCGDDGRTCCETDPRCGPGLSCTTSATDVDRCRPCGEHELACCAEGAACGPGLACATGGVCRLPSETP